MPAWHYWLYWAGLLCVLAATLGAFGVTRWSSLLKQSQTGISRDNASALRLRLNSYSGVDLQQRRLYPYSVIPGGVRSAEELRNAIAHDPLVAELYANFDLSRAHIIRLSRDREVYVSYRLGNHIYWTKKRLLLRAGETVITDGKHQARTRCGNLICETPVQPVSPIEPPNAAMNAPPAYPLFADNSEPLLLLPEEPLSVDSVGPSLPSFPPPPSAPPISVIPPPFFPIVGGGPPSFPNVNPPPPPVATPEPGPLAMLILGLTLLATLAGVSKLLKYRKSEPGKQ